MGIENREQDGREGMKEEAAG